MQGRDPRDAWAFTQRICGVCTVVHAVASCRAVEDALDIHIPANANTDPQPGHGMQFIQDHVIHFYHLHALDWVDVVSALSANPAAAAEDRRSRSRPGRTTARRTSARCRRGSRSSCGSGQLGIFADGYWGHPAYKLPPEVNLLAVAHYLEALDWQRDVIRLHTIFGGKNPHPNFLVGGMASAINLDSTATINAERIDRHPGHDPARARRSSSRCTGRTSWRSPASTRTGARSAAACRNYLAVRRVPRGDVRDIDKLYFPRGIILNKDLTKVLPEYDQKKVQEYIHSSWYEYAKGDEAGLHPYEGETTPKYTGPKTPWTYPAGREEVLLDEVAALRRARRCRWARWRACSSPTRAGHKDVRELVGSDAQRSSTSGRPPCSRRSAAPPRAESRRCCSPAGWSSGSTSWSTASRTATPRTFTTRQWEPAKWPARPQGYGYLDAPRGALGPLGADRGRQDLALPVRGAQSPGTARRATRQGQPGPYEASLTDNHPLVDPERPLEILRTIHSFDPCMACGVHVLDAEGRGSTEVKVQ